MEHRGIGSVGLTVPDPEAWAAFATEVIGLQRAPVVPGEDPMAPTSGGTGRADDGTIHLKMDDRLWRLSLQEGEPGIAHIGVEYAGAAAYEAALVHLSERGLAAVRATPDELASRAVAGMAHVTDPSGNRVELYHGPTRERPFVSPVGVAHFVTGALGFGHVVLLVSDLHAHLAFWQEAMGFRLTDYVEIGPGMSVQFLRCSPRHHSLALTAVGPIDGVHHVMFEVGDIDEVGRALDRATSAGCEITASLGRHRNDRMLSFYLRSPAGIEVEVGCDALLVDEDTWVVNHFTGGDEWGHHGLTAKAMESAGEAMQSGGQE